MSLQVSVTPPVVLRIPAQNGVKSVSSYARLSRYARCSLDACRTHGGYALTERGRGRESGGGVEGGVGGAGYPLETECPGLQLDTEAPLGVTAALSGAVWRAGWPSTALIVPHVEETRKPLRLIARNSPAKQSSTTYHFINLSSPCESPPTLSPHPHSAPANLPEISDE